MTHYEVISLGLSIIGVLLLPIIIMLFRAMIRWVHTEDQLTHLVTDMRELVENKDKVHTDIMRQMSYDRDATNTRLRYLEEYFMNHGMRK